MIDTLPMVPTERDLLPGTVLMFTRDMTFLGGNWVHRTMGTHYIVGEVSGWTVALFDTRRGVWTNIMREQWILDHMRVIPSFERKTDCTCECTCAHCW